MKRLKDIFIAPLFAKPHRFAGGLIANILGLQIIRELWYRAVVHSFRSLLYTSRLEDGEPHLETLRRDGVLIIPNFLAQKDFEQIRREYERLLPQAEFKPMGPEEMGEDVQLFKAHIYPRNHHLFGKLIRKHFLENITLKNIANDFLRRDSYRFDKAIVSVNKNKNPDIPDVSSARAMHYDSPSVSFKMFYYLSDIDEKNGAFTYAKGSHRLTPYRLWWGYKKSIVVRWSALKFGDKRRSFDDKGKVWHFPTKEEAKRLGLIPTSMVGKANSLVIFDVRGFHTQGVFSDGRLREFIEISCRPSGLF